MSSHGSVLALTHRTLTVLGGQMMDRLRVGPIRLNPLTGAPCQITILGLNHDHTTFPRRAGD